MTRHVVAAASEIGPGQRKIVELDGRSIGVFNIGGEYFALLNQCPHAGAELCGFGTISGVSSAAAPDQPITYERSRSLRCPWHQWEFDIRTGESWYDPGNTRVRSYQVEVVAGSPETVVDPHGGRQAGPHIVEGYEVAIEGDVLVVDTSVRRRGTQQAAAPGARKRRVGRRAANPDALTETDVVVREVIATAEDVVALAVEPASGGVLPAWRPGAHIDLMLGPGLERQYSLCGDPQDRSTWRIGVLRERQSRGGSAFVHERVRPGDTLRCRGPRNNFPLEAAEEYVFVAGGIGITPILPMIARCEAEGRPWRLHYGGRSAASMAFTTELAAFGDRVRTWPQDEVGLIDLAAALGRPRPGVGVYCCGPEPLLAAVERACTGWPAGTVHVERFKPRPGARDGIDTPFDVMLAGTGQTLTVPVGRSIADVLDDAGVPVPTSCREGTCGTCETAVLDGLPDHRDSYLNETERSSGDVIMVCCSRSHSPRLVLDL